MRGVLCSILVLISARVGLAQDRPVGVPVSGELHGARQPQVAVASNGNVFVTFGQKDDIYCAASTDQGTLFSKPVKVGTPGVLSLGKRRGPRIAATDRLVVVTAIGGKQGKGQDGDVLVWRSTNAGKTWDGPTTINTVSGSAREGLHHLTVLPNGTFYCVWLDLRADAMQVYGASSMDGVKWQDEKLVYKSPDGSICPCCQPVVTADAKGNLYVMWRNDLGGSRDMFWSMSRDGGQNFSEAARLGRETWPLKTCPMDGGFLAADGRGQLTSIWRREKQVYRCKPGEAEELLGSGEQGWAAANTSGVHLIWLQGRPGALQYLSPGAIAPVRLADAATDPVIAGSVTGSGPLVVAWEEGTGHQAKIRAIRVQDK